MNQKVGTFGAAILAADSKGTVRAKWAHAQASQRTHVGWEHPLFGEMLIYVSNFRLDNQQDRNGYYWSNINLDTSTPPALFVRFGANLNEHVVGIYSARDGNVEDCTAKMIPPLRVPIEWRDSEHHEHKVPHTRQRGVDNVDIVLLLQSGAFMQLQVSVLTRGGKFFLSVQEIWGGEILELAEGVDAGELQFVEIDGQRYTVAPIWSEQAYPGGSYLKTFKNMGPKVIRYATETSECQIPLARTLVPMEWDPPSFPENEKGWEGGIVTFFNPIVMGRALLKDGRDVYINLASILNEQGQPELHKGGFPLLEPKQRVMLRIAKGDQGWYAKSVKAAA